MPTNNPTSNPTKPPVMPATFHPNIAPLPGWYRDVKKIQKGNGTDT